MSNYVIFSRTKKIDKIQCRCYNKFIEKECLNVEHISLKLTILWLIIIVLTYYAIFNKLYVTYVLNRDLIAIYNLLEKLKNNLIFDIKVSIL